MGEGGETHSSGELRKRRVGGGRGPVAYCISKPSRVILASSAFLANAHQKHPKKQGNSPACLTAPWSSQPLHEFLMVFFSHPLLSFSLLPAHIATAIKLNFAYRAEILIKAAATKDIESISQSSFSIPSPPLPSSLLFSPLLYQYAKFINIKLW